jgi:flagellar biosynthetic protein FliR
MVPRDAASLAAFLLLLGRLSGLVLVVPFLGQRNIPVMVKAAVVLVLAVVLAPMVEVPPEALKLDVVFILRMAFEVLVGLFIGYIFLAVFMAVTVAGQFIDFELGFGLAQVFDPSFGAASTILSRFYYLLALVVFLSCNGHHLILLSLVGSYKVFPAGSLALHNMTSPVALRVLADVFLLAVKVGAPVIGVLFVADVVFGIVARAVPQMNVFVIGFPVKILLGLLAVAITLPFTVNFMRDMVTALEGVLARIF